MYPLRDVEQKDRASGMRLRAGWTDDTDEDRDRRDSERETLAPPMPLERRRSDTPRKLDVADALSEVLFRAACGDHEGALMAAENLMARVPVVLMTKEDLRSEPLGYWDLHLLARIDAMSSLAELIDDGAVPPAEVIRVVCELVERKVIALR